MMNGNVSVSAIVPTYRRTTDLARCLRALAAQYRRADEIVVVVRSNDTDTLAWLDAYIASAPEAAVRIALVEEAGVVAAYNRGLDTAAGRLMCFCDDDAAPKPDWIDRIVRAFLRDPALGGFGGRDIVHERGTVLEGARSVVGVVRWYGRAIGNHHLGTGGPREVQVLKGVNMAFRREAVDTLRFDARLLGGGAQVHCEMAFCLDVLRRGWTLVYDPALVVDHYPAPRSDEDQRYTFNDNAFYNASFNLRLIMCEHLSPIGRRAFVAYASLIGNRADPGFVRALLLALGGEGIALALRKWWVGLRAMRAAWQQAMH